MPGCPELVQECPDALNTLKYFREKANGYHVIAAGDLLGTLPAEPKSYPVGMVNLIDLYPLTFGEFLKTADRPLYAYYAEITKSRQIEGIFHSRLLDAYNSYLIIGGCRSAFPHGYRTATRRGSPESSGSLSKSMKMTFPNTTGR